MRTPNYFNPLSKREGNGQEKINTMTWEQKTEMIRQCNKGNYTDATQLFYDNISTADEQAFDMFTTGLELTPKVIRNDIELHNKIVEVIKTKTSSSFRTAMRMAYYEQLVEDSNLPPSNTEAK